MADKNARVPENVPGKWYVDENCILCSLCEMTAPDNFSAAEEYDFVHKQPEGDEEIEQCLQAMDECPVEAIGNDGEEG